MKRVRQHGYLLLAVILCSICCYSQNKSKRSLLKDSLDGAFDLSDYIIEANGFVPIPYIITEPALGGFGIALVPVFIKKRPPYADSVKGELRLSPVAPDITGAAAIYTLNKTWLLGAFRSGTFVKSRIKYTVGGGYGNIVMSFYKTFDQIGEKELKFKIKSFAALVQATKRIGFSRWYAGTKYLYLNSDVSYIGNTNFDSLASSFTNKSTISQLGVLVDYDGRDNIFTPDNGIKFHIDGNWSDEFLGSDFNYWRLNYYAYLYKSFSSRWVGGWRLDGQQTFGDPAFYLQPFIDMRGVPANRYQGHAAVLTELEARWNFVNRWSLMLFAGCGKAMDSWSDFGSADWVISGGTGFRYLLARKFKLRIGLDIAHGPDTWAYYIVFGSNWLK
jgi:hypothetical protein